jgi:hypothetical protein
MLSMQHDAQLDFRMAHCAARCLVEHCDPYKQSDVMRIYREEGATLPTTPADIATLDFETRYIYLPTVFTVMLPLSLVPFAVAKMTWIVVIAASFIFATFLMWNLAADYAPLLSAALLCFYLANSGSLISAGNPAGLCVSLCAIAVWCFFRERFVVAGILCLAASLALKPHDSGLVWLYFLLAGGTYRRRAVQTFAVLVGATLPIVLWLTYIAPRWTQEMRLNVVALSLRGGVSDPGPASVLHRGTFMITDLQAVFSIFWDNPHFYNLASYALCGALLLTWMLVTLRTRVETHKTWLAISSIAALTLLPVYHRQYDARLIILTIPACAWLWARGGLTARVALLINSIGFILTADLPWAFFLALLPKLHMSTTGVSGYLLIAMLAFPVPLILLAMAVFYLRIYIKQSFESVPSPDPSSLRRRSHIYNELAAHQPCGASNHKRLCNAPEIL